MRCILSLNLDNKISPVQSTSARADWRRRSTLNLGDIATFGSLWPWPWIRVKVIPLCISHRVLPVCQISSKSMKLFVDGWTYGNLTPILLGRLPKFGSRPKHMMVECEWCWPLKQITNHIKRLLGFDGKSNRNGIASFFVLWSKVSKCRKNNFCLRPVFWVT